jgi:hypothetical protein
MTVVGHGASRKLSGVGEREEACQNAAKTQPGFGERLRSWFGRKPSNP